MGRDIAQDLGDPLVQAWQVAWDGHALAGWLVATWQFSLGFTLGLMVFYLLAGGTLAVALLWWRRGRPRPRPPRRVLVASAAGMLCFALVAVLLARPYIRVLEAHLEARRTIENVAGFCGPPYEFLAAARSGRVWGAATEPLREGLNAIPEMTLFPGLAILILALAGWRIGTLPAPLRRGLAIGVLAFAILSLGFQINGFSWLYPYRWLYEFLPGWQGIRVPGRLHTLTTLCLALLAGAGAAACRGRSDRRCVRRARAARSSARGPRAGRAPRSSARRLRSPCGRQSRAPCCSRTARSAACAPPTARRRRTRRARAPYATCRPPAASSAAMQEARRVSRPPCYFSDARNRSVAVFARSRLPASSRARTLARYVPAGNAPLSSRRQLFVPCARR